MQHSSPGGSEYQAVTVTIDSSREQAFFMTDLYTLKSSQFSFELKRKSMTILLPESKTVSVYIELLNANNMLTHGGPKILEMCW